MNKYKTNLRFLLGWPLTIISLFFIFKFISGNLSSVIPRLTNINFAYLGIAILLFFAYYFLRSLLWKVLLTFMDQKIHYIDNAYAFEMSELKRFIPGNIWSLLGRADMYSKMGVDKNEIAKGILIEIQLLILGCLIISFFSFSWLLKSNGLLINHLGSLLPLSVFATVMYFPAVAYIFKKKYRKNHSIISSLLIPGLPFIQRLILIIFSIIVFFVFGAANFFTLLTIFPLDFSNFFILSSFFTFALLIGYVSFITPMGLGVREGIIAFGLLRLMPISLSSFFALYSRIVLIISELFYASVVFIIFHFRKIKQ